MLHLLVIGISVSMVTSERPVRVIFTPVAERFTTYVCSGREANLDLTSEANTL